MDVMRAEAEVSRRDQDLTVAKTNLQLQESLIKNALTKNLDDPTLESMPVIPTDMLDTVQEIPEKPTQELIAQALHGPAGTVGVGHRLAKPRDHPQSRSQCTAAHADAGRVLWWHRIGRRSNPFYTEPNTPLVPTNWWGGFQDSFNNTSPDYLVGLNLALPIRNRVAKADQYRSELEYRQAELREQQLKKQIRIEVRNAEYALEQGRARVEAAEEVARSGRKDFHDHAERADTGRWLELSDFDRAA